MIASQDDLAEVAGLGTTGLDHEHSGMITIAARWLADQVHAVPQAPVRFLVESFGLPVGDAICANAEAKRIRSGAA